MQWPFKKKDEEKKPEPPKPKGKKQEAKVIDPVPVLDQVDLN